MCVRSTRRPAGSETSLHPTPLHLSTRPLSTSPHRQRFTACREDGGGGGGQRRRHHVQEASRIAKLHTVGRRDTGLVLQLCERSERDGWCHLVRR